MCLDLIPLDGASLQQLVGITEENPYFLCSSMEPAILQQAANNFPCYLYLQLAVSLTT